MKHNRRWEISTITVEKTLIDADSQESAINKFREMFGDKKISKIVVVRKE